MTLLRRIVREHRTAMLPLAIVLVLDLAAYAIVVYPLGVKSATARQRADAAHLARLTAESAENAAKARVASKARAEQELGTFYARVLPANQTAARNMTYTSIPELARKANVRWQDRRWEPDEASAKANGPLGHMKIRMTFQGEYDNLRQFIYDLESAPPFVIIDGVTLQQPEAGKPLTLIIDLSTYYRLGADGA